MVAADLKGLVAETPIEASKPTIYGFETVLVRGLCRRCEDKDECMSGQLKGMQPMAAQCINLANEQKAMREARLLAPTAPKVPETPEETTRRLAAIVACRNNE